MSSEFVSLLSGTASKLGLGLQNWRTLNIAELELIFLEILLPHTPKVRVIDMGIEGSWNKLWCYRHLQGRFRAYEPSVAFTLRHLRELTLRGSILNHGVYVDLAPLVNAAPNLRNLRLSALGYGKAANNVPLAASNITALYIYFSPTLHCVPPIIRACRQLQVFYMNLHFGRKYLTHNGLLEDREAGVDMGTIIDALKKHVNTLHTVALCEMPTTDNQPDDSITGLRELVNVKVLFITPHILLRKKTVGNVDSTLPEIFPPAVEVLHLEDYIDEDLVQDLRALDRSLESGNFQQLREIMVYQNDGCCAGVDVKAYSQLVKKPDSVLPFFKKSWGIVHCTYGDGRRGYTRL